VELNIEAPEQSQYERNDICAVPAASVVVENVAAFEVARAFCEKFAGDSLVEVRGQVELYLKLVRGLPLEEGRRLA
jgi:chorismate synthase